MSLTRPGAKETNVARSLNLSVRMKIDKTAKPRAARFFCGPSRAEIVSSHSCPWVEPRAESRAESRESNLVGSQSWRSANLLNLWVSSPIMGSQVSFDEPLITCGFRELAAPISSPTREPHAGSAQLLARTRRLLVPWSVRRVADACARQRCLDLSVAWASCAR